MNVATSVPGSTSVKSISPSAASVSSVTVMSTRPATRSSGSPSIPVSVSVTAIATGSAGAADVRGAALSAGARVDGHRRRRRSSGASSDHCSGTDRRADEMPGARSPRCVVRCHVIPPARRSAAEARAVIRRPVESAEAAGYRRRRSLSRVLSTPRRLGVRSTIPVLEQQVARRRHAALARLRRLSTTAASIDLDHHHRAIADVILDIAGPYGDLAIADVHP